MFGIVQYFTTTWICQFNFTNCYYYLIDPSLNEALKEGASENINC